MFDLFNRKKVIMLKALIKARDEQIAMLEQHVFTHQPKKAKNLLTDMKASDIPKYGGRIQLIKPTRRGKKENQGLIYGISDNGKPVTVTKARKLKAKKK